MLNDFRLTLKNSLTTTFLFHLPVLGKIQGRIQDFQKGGGGGAATSSEGARFLGGSGGIPPRHY